MQGLALRAVHSGLLDDHGADGWRQVSLRWG